MSVRRSFRVTECKSFSRTRFTTLTYNLELEFSHTCEIRTTEFIEYSPVPSRINSYDAVVETTFLTVKDRPFETALFRPIVRTCIESESIVQGRLCQMIQTLETLTSLREMSMPLSQWHGV